MLREVLLMATKNFPPKSNLWDMMLYLTEMDAGADFLSDLQTEIEELETLAPFTTLDGALEEVEEVMNYDGRL